MDIRAAQNNFERLAPRYFSTQELQMDYVQTCCQILLEQPDMPLQEIAVQGKRQIWSQIRAKGERAYFGQEFLPKPLGEMISDRAEYDQGRPLKQCHVRILGETRTLTYGELSALSGLGVETLYKKAAAKTPVAVLVRIDWL